MKNFDKKEPLYRKVNTTTRGVHHNSGSDFRHDRNTKAQKNSEEIFQGMGKKAKRGLDYTPLYRFLLSKVGKDWNSTHSEAVSRLDHEDPVYHIVLEPHESKESAPDYVCGGENSYFSQLYVDENNILQKVNPDFNPKEIPQWCTCCTVSFNSLPLKKDKEVVEDLKKKLSLF